MTALQDYLNNFKITQRKFSESLGIHYMYLNQIANGIRRPSPELALKIEQATDGQVTLRELLFPSVSLHTPTRGATKDEQ